MSAYSDLQTRLINAANAGKQMFLGRLVYYTVNDLRMDHSEVVRRLVAAGIDKSLPLMPKDSDTFRRVTKECERKKEPTSNPNVYENFLVRDVPEGNGKIVRRIVVEQVDGGGRRLTYDQAYDVTFEKAGGKFEALALPGYRNPMADVIAAEMQQKYNSQRGSVTGYTVREWVRHFIIRLGATVVRNGLYFVPEEFAAEVQAVEEFVNGLGNGSSCSEFPLVDDTKQREMLQRAFEAETADEIDSLLVKMQEIQTSGQKITEKAYQEYLNKYHALTGKTKEYGNLLEQTLDNTHSRLQIFESSVVQMLGLVKH